MPTFTTNADSTHPSLPPIQSPTTDSSPPGVDNEEIVVVDVISPASTTHRCWSEQASPKFIIKTLSKFDKFLPKFNSLSAMDGHDRPLKN
jgi:hypothetical protein